MNNLPVTDVAANPASAASAAPVASTAANKLKAADQAAQGQGGSQSVDDTAQSCPLLQRFAIEAVVVGEDDKPLMDVAVELRKSPNEVLRDKTGADGVVRFEQLVGGSYQLSLYELDKEAWELISTAALSKPKSEGDASWQAPTPPENAEEFTHTVVQGECTSQLAYQYGFFPDTVWNWGPNAQLKTQRKDMHILYGGDQLVIPPTRNHAIPAATGQRYVLRRRGVPEKLHVRFLDYDEMPRSGLRFSISIATSDDAVLKEIAGKTDADGYVNASIPPNAVAAEITLFEGTVTEVHKFELGHVDPIDTVVGWQERLNNLGFYCGDERGEIGELTKAAIKEFQKKRKLTETGNMDDSTKQALLQLSLS